MYSLPVIITLDPVLCQQDHCGRPRAAGFWSPEGLFHNWTLALLPWSLIDAFKSTYSDRLVRSCYSSVNASTTCMALFSFCTCRYIQAPFIYYPWQTQSWTYMQSCGWIWCMRQYLLCEATRNSSSSIWRKGMCENLIEAHHLVRIGFSLSYACMTRCFFFLHSTTVLLCGVLACCSLDPC